MKNNFKRLKQKVKKQFKKKVMNRQFKKESKLKRPRKVLRFKLK